MALTLPDGGIAKTIQGGNYRVTPSVQANKTKANPTGQSYIGGGVGAPAPQQQMPAGYNELTGLFQSLLPGAMPGIISADNKIGNYNSLLGQLFAHQDTQGGLLQQQQSNQLRNVDLQGEGLGLQREILARQRGLMPQQNALQEQLYALNQSAINANRGELNQMFGLGQQDISRARGEAAQQYGNARQDLSGSLAARGAGITPGATTGFNRLSDQLASQLAGLDSQSQKNQVGYNARLGDIGRAEQQQGINRQQYGLNYGEQLKQLEDQEKNLNLLAKSHGISREEIENRTQQALAQLGLSTTLSAGQIYESIINAQNGKFDSLTPILGAIYQYIGLRPVANG